MSTTLPRMCEDLLQAIEELRRTLSPVAMSAGLEYMEDCANRRDCFVSKRCQARLHAVRALEPMPAAEDEMEKSPRDLTFGPPCLRVV